MLPTTDAPASPPSPSDGAAAAGAPDHAARDGEPPAAGPEAAGATAVTAAPRRPPFEPAHTLTGDVRRHEGFRSRYLAVPHDVLVYLPPGYEREPQRRYPVLYLQDGQNLFDEATAFSHEWQVDETAERLIARGEIAPVIVVGIANAGERRMDEYTPTRDRRHHAGGGATRYGRMLVEELKPFVDATYRTLPDPAYTGLGGSSLGGLLSLFLGLQYPGLFRRLAVLSPSVWWDDRFIVRRVRLLSHRPPLRIWLSVGTEEGAGVVEAGEALRDALVERGWREGEDLEFRVLAGARHEETAWAALMEPVLKYLFPVEG